MVKVENLLKRIVSGIFIVLITLGANYQGGLFYIAYSLILAILMCYEAISIIYSKEKKILSLRFLEHSMLAILYALLFSMSMIIIRSLGVRGYYMTLYAFSIVWTTDSLAYFFGSLIGGRKLAPQISPSKTISGLVCGSLSGSIVGILFGLFTKCMPVWHIILLSPILAFGSQIGDLIESVFKRKFGVKDSSNLIPGHGGVLDRVDGLSFAFMLFAAYVSLISYIK